MYNRYTCPVQPCRHLILKLLIQGHPRNSIVHHVVVLKVLMTRLLLVLEVCNVKPNNRKSWATNLLMWCDLTLKAKLKTAYNLLIIFLKVFDVKPTYGKSWAGNLLMWSDLALGPLKVK